jgi:carbon monoxide dehydrogenase subunit G
VKLEGTHELDASRERVYQCLVNPEVLQRCIPGCEKLEKTGENTFAATIRAGVGSIKGVFNGTARLEDLREPEHLRLVVDGKGAPGFLKGSGDLDLEQTDNGTKVSYVGWRDDRERGPTHDSGNGEDDGHAVLHEPGC